MSDKRMLIVPAELVKKIDENRGDMGQAEFIDFLIDSHFKQEENPNGRYVNIEEFHVFEQGMKDLFRSFLDFFLSFGLEIGHNSPNNQSEEFDHKLQGLEERLENRKGERRAKIDKSQSEEFNHKLQGLEERLNNRKGERRAKIKWK